ncbi:copper homeostasis CutC domain-containing protein [Immersiella caudata]|uniref:Copper homeostasis protein cutC homolog n=1 Tax=Immersiella caudata TaxID=314043 RepID=A0AA39X3R5_9PEZI|nr:copper homeostasis CutC domain-containing protein [Immersiella caudata]
MASNSTLTAAQLEVPIFGPDTGALAVVNGARRLELNHAGSYALGGTTPTLPELSFLVASLSTPQNDIPIPVRIMIRPRGPGGPDTQDFLYTPSEIATMRESIIAFKASGLLNPSRGDGFVFGLLRRRGARLEIDVETNRELVETARPYKAVFHRAFDDVLSVDPALGLGESGRGAMECLVECGLDGVLTSGGRGGVMVEGNGERLGDVVRELRGRVEVVVGGGVRSKSVRELRGVVQGEGVWFHSSCLVAVGGEMEFDEGEVRALVENLS